MNMQNLWTLTTESPGFREAFTADQRERLLAAQSEMLIPKGDLVYHQGQTPTHLYLVQEGTVRQFRRGSNGRAQVLRFIGRGEVFGYRAAIADESYAVNAAAQVSTTLSAYPISLIRTLLDESARLRELVLTQLARELGMADRRLVSLTQGNLRQRLAETLLFLSRPGGSDLERSPLELALTRRELADSANMSTSNAIRTLKELEREGLVGVEGRTIRLLDERKLRRLSLFD